MKMSVSKDHYALFRRKYNYNLLIFQHFKPYFVQKYLEYIRNATFTFQTTFQDSSQTRASHS